MPFFNPFRKISESIRRMAEENERIARYTSLSAEELCELDDAELIEAATARINGIIREKNELMRAILELNPEQQVFYFVQNYVSQLESGGLWQYFADSSRRNVPYLSGSLEAIGAEEHLALFQSFIEKNHIDVNDPINFSTFDLRRSEENGSSLFTDFDRAYRQLPPITEQLRAYIRSHITSF